MNVARDIALVNGIFYVPLYTFVLSLCTYVFYFIIFFAYGFYCYCKDASVAVIFFFSFFFILSRQKYIVFFFLNNCQTFIYSITTLNTHCLLICMKDLQSILLK